MPLRSKNTLVVLVTLLICAAPFQTAVCELACGLRAHAPSCHAAANSTDSMEMGAGCTHTAATSTKHGLNFNCPDANCQHPSAWAFQKSAPAEILLPPANYAVLVSGSNGFALPELDLVATKSPPFLFACTDPLHTSLRI